MANLALPGNPRYQPKNLQQAFGYDNLFREVARVEIATLEVLGEIGVIPSSDISLFTEDMKNSLLLITTSEVDVIERGTEVDAIGRKITKHDIRAWVRIAQEKMPPQLRRWLHIPLTSYDALDTARSIQFASAHADVVRPLTDKVIHYFVEQVRLYADTLQIGRTHGQHALPITVGFWLATILSRIVSNIQDANKAASKLVGKISGAVGAYNAQVGLGIADRCGDKTFEKRVLEKLGLKPARISTQILPPEPLSNYLFACVELSASFGQFGRDGRNLMRTEIGELHEPFEKNQVASSTMASKRNPVGLENLEGMWIKNKNEFGNVLDTMLSDHQRDLVGSSISRDFPTIIVNLVTQLNTLLRKSGDESDNRPFITRISIDEDACKRNFKMQGDGILAEPIYIALQMAGYEGDAHDLINHRALAYAKEQKTSLLQATYQTLIADVPEVYSRIWNNIPENTLRLLQHPENYTGAASTKAYQIADMAEAYLNIQAQ